MTTTGLLQNTLKNKDIIKTSAFRTFDFHEMEGKPQTSEANRKIHDNIIYYPSSPMTQGGESFEHAIQRAFVKLHEIMKEKGNFIIVTHNSMYGLLKVWNEEGRPQELSKKFREKYANQDTPHGNAKSTGEHFEMKEPNGILYICRHGETSDNASGVFRTSKATLTDKGKEQAKHLGEILKNKDIKKIYTSDLPRALETSEIINKIIK